MSDVGPEAVVREIRAAAREANMASDYASQRTLQDWADRLAAPAQQDTRECLANVLQLARLKWGNLDADANKVFERAEALLATSATQDKGAES